jgi:hypothetical protein
MVNYQVNDANGNPLPGASISQTVAGGWCKSVTTTGSTDSNGSASIYDGCPFPASVAWTVTSPGYTSQSGNVSTSFLSPPTVTVTLRSVAEPAPSGSGQSFINSLLGGSNGCPSGYVLDSSSGQCVQQSSPNTLTNLFNLIKTNWLLILVLAVAAALIALLFVNPKSIASVVGAVAQ